MIVFVRQGREFLWRAVAADARYEALVRKLKFAT